MKCAGKTKCTMVIRRMLVLVGRRERTPVRPMQAKLGERKFVNDSSIRYLDANDRQQKRLHNKRIDNRSADQPSPETRFSGSAVRPDAHDCAPYTVRDIKFKRERPQPRRAYGASSTANNPSSFMTASQRPRASRLLFIGPSFAKADMGIIYLNPGPPLRGRMMATANVPSGAFSGAIVSVRWPTDAYVAIAMPSAKQAQGDLSLS